MTETKSLGEKTSWQTVMFAMVQKETWIMLFLGFSSGLPYFLIFGTLSLWLREAGVERSIVTYFSWAALGFSFKFIWAPLVDRLPLPVFTQAMGQRRSWLLLSQIMIMGSLIWIGLSNPEVDLGLHFMAIGAVMLGFSAATQDITIDALRIELTHESLQAMLSATYVSGYRIGMLVSGAGGLYLAEGLGSTKEAYSLSAWQFTYWAMAICMIVGVVTGLLLREPASSQERRIDHSVNDYIRFFLTFIVAVLAVIVCYRSTSEIADFFKSMLIDTTANNALAGFIVNSLRLSIAAVAAVVVFTIFILFRIVPRQLVLESYWEPIADFFKRYGLPCILVLLLVGLYRISDVVLGVIAHIFYEDMGYTKKEIANVSKVYGLWMTIIGGFLGGAFTIRFGVMKMLFLGAFAAALTNVLFALLSMYDKNIWYLIFTISADNLSSGFASVVFIAWLSSLTNIKFTANQYAIFSSLMTLFPKVLGGYSGSIVDTVGYPTFFIFTALIGIPVLILIVLVGMFVKSNPADSTSEGSTA